MKKRKLMLIIGIFLLGISTVYAVTIIRAADVTYDNSKSNGSSSNVQGAIDELYSYVDGTCSSGGSTTTRGTNFIEYITNLAESDKTNLAYDDTSDKNLRYIGSNPNNYVKFNDELWRIIGVMNNVKDESGNSELRVKLIRSESIGNLSWNTSNINDWSNASLKSLFNMGDYYNRLNNYKDNGLTEKAKAMISNIEWNLGGLNSNSYTSKTFYESERGKVIPSGGQTIWQGYVGLMYPSDYGYAVGGSVRNTCLLSNLGVYNSNACFQNNWLFLNSYQWTLTPFSSRSDCAFAISSAGWMDSPATYASYVVRPVVYLNTNINRLSGTGTSDDPYIITNKTTIKSANISPPKLDEEGKLIPVILSDDGTVTYTRENGTNWYNYDEQRWANAVILIDSPLKNYKVGDVIKENDIESYFVWIPKYKYKLWNVDSIENSEKSLVHEIDIIFDTNDTKDIEGISCKTPMGSGESGNCNNGEYMTHPAFISLGVDGFWVGKFETGYKGATSTSASEINSSDSLKIIIKPNVYSWRYNTVYNFFTSSYNYERSLDSHMMKNTEWGAVAYLSHSRYGINKEVNINNNSSYKTGYSALPNTDQSKYPGTSGDGASYNQPYNTEIGYLASTTGNITGVYDMSGGTHEFMASYVGGQLGKSGFTATTIKNYNTKYFDIYSTSNTIRILGDATGEMGPFLEYSDSDGTSRYHNSWYSDHSQFIGSTHTWFTRGGNYSYGVVAGQFGFNKDTGLSLSYISSRLVLSP